MIRRGIMFGDSVTKNYPAQFLTCHVSRPRPRPPQGRRRFPNTISCVPLRCPAHVLGLRGNPVRIRDCPAAVNGNESKPSALNLTTRIAECEAAFDHAS